MRTEHYADSRDEWKWSVAIRQAREAGQSIFWVVMLRPFVGQRDYDRQPVTDALQEVTQFFAQERQHLDAGQPKSLARITKLCSSLGVELFSDMEDYPATLGERGRYFGNILRALEARQAHLKHLVFLDPDNGIGVAKTKGEQVHESHLQELWDHLRKGDTLGLVQFEHRLRAQDWRVVLRDRIANLLHVQPQQVRSRWWDNLCIYLADR
jgi:hypothetical protein